MTGDRRRQEGVQLEVVREAEAHDLALVVHRERVEQVHLRIADDELVEVHHHTVAPQEGTDGNIRTRFTHRRLWARHADHLASVVDPIGDAAGVILYGAKALHSRVAGPQEGVERRRARYPDNLTAVVDGKGGADRVGGARRVQRNRDVV